MEGKIVKRVVIEDKFSGEHESGPYDSLLAFATSGDGMTISAVGSFELDDLLHVMGNLGVMFGTMIRDPDNKIRVLEMALMEFGCGLFDSDGQSRMVAESVAQEFAAGLLGKEI